MPHLDVAEAAWFLGLPPVNRQNQGRGRTRDGSRASFFYSGGGRSGPRRDNQAGQTCQICKRTLHTAEYCYDRRITEKLRLWDHARCSCYSGECYPTQNATSQQSHAPTSASGENMWIMDSGAANHITYDSGKFYKKQPYDSGGFIITGDGSTQTITHIGNIRLKTQRGSIDIHGVFLVHLLIRGRGSPRLTDPILILEGLATY